MWFRWTYIHGGGLGGGYIVISPCEDTIYYSDVCYVRIDNYFLSFLVDDPTSFIPKSLSQINDSYVGQLMGYSLKSFGNRIVVREDMQ